MRMSAKVLNAKQVMKDLEGATEDMERAFGKALKRAGLLVQRESMKVTPVDTGALKLSAFTMSEGKGTDTVVTVGYRQAYAIYVHELHPSKSKFLEKTYRRLLPKITEELVKAMRNA